MLMFKGEKKLSEKMGWWVSEIIKNNNWTENWGREVECMNSDLQFHEPTDDPR